MSRATVCALVVALQSLGPLTVKQLARECLTDDSNIREWLYAFEGVGLVRRVGKRTGKGKSSGRSTIYWEWVVLPRRNQNGCVPQNSDTPATGSETLSSPGAEEVSSSVAAQRPNAG